MGPDFHLFRSVNILQAMNANNLQHKSDTWAWLLTKYDYRQAKSNLKWKISLFLIKIDLEKEFSPLTIDILLHSNDKDIKNSHHTWWKFY
jgi:hypothetical protein